MYKLKVHTSFLLFCDLEQFVHHAWWQVAQGVSFLFLSLVLAVDFFKRQSDSHFKLSANFGPS